MDSNSGLTSEPNDGQGGQHSGVCNNVTPTIEYTKKSASTPPALDPRSQSEFDLQAPLLCESPRSNSRDIAAECRPSITDPLDEFDEYGTELQKDAQVWKVYVKETDKWDGELADGWNKSMDVILLFAALFSAISTAFLIESSKALQADPAEVSAQTLVVISQTLFAIANNPQSPGLTPPPTNSSVSFTPSRNAVLINTLWYLSLSLSLATSFIAILAKDWCYVFTAGRTGHPYSQSHRRQQKWDMIERWRMRELLAVLPSLIHVALFLFAIGLCIQLWEKHTIVAIPVISISGAATAFYIWSSMVGILLDFFPYATIISRLWRTRQTQNILESLRPVTRPLLRLIFQGLRWLARPLPAFLAGLQHFLQIMDVIPESIITNVPLWFLWQVVYLDVRLHRGGIAWLEPMPRVLLLLVVSSIWSTAYLAHGPISWLIARLNALKLRTQAFVSNKQTPSHRHGRVTSAALSWLITNCETSQPVEIALQSIAGANATLSHEPLQGCNAALEILRRLASGRLYKHPNKDKVLSLYSRALSFLAPKDSSSPEKDVLTENPELISMIWDLQGDNENNVATLIADGNFDPVPSNLTALQISSTAASQSLQIIKKDYHSANTALDSIFQRLDRCLRDRDVPALHPSAVLSLVNAGTLLTVFLPDHRVSADLPGLCLKLLQSQHERMVPHLSAALTGCILLRHKYDDWKKSNQHTDAAWAGCAVRALTEWQSRQKESVNILAEICILELSSHPGIHFTAPTSTQTPSNKNIEDILNDLSYHSGFTDTVILQDRHINKASILHYLRALVSIYDLLKVEAPRPDVHLFVVGSMCCAPNTYTRTLCGRLMSSFQFPSLTDDFVDLLEKRQIIPRLEKAEKSKDTVIRFFAASQLWLLHTLCQNVPESTPSRERLLKQLQASDKHSTETGTRYVKLGRLIETIWDRADERIIETLGVYAHRLMECVHQANECPVPKDIETSLHALRPCLRGLPSFTGWRSTSAKAPETEAHEIKPQPTEISSVAVGGMEGGVAVSDHTVIDISGGGPE